MFGELEKTIFGPEKDKWWIWGCKTQKPPEMPIKLGKTSQHHNWPRYMDGPQIGPKFAIKQGKKRQKDKRYPFRAPTKPKIPPPPLKRGILWTWVFSCRTDACFQASTKWAQPFPAPELRAKFITDTRIFLKLTQRTQIRDLHDQHDRICHHCPLGFPILVAPRCSRLRCYRCGTQYRGILFKGGWHSPKSTNPNFWVRIFSGGVGVFHVKGWGSST